MIDKIIYGENIALSSAEGIVNAANGFGYMGGERCIREQHTGVAESIQFVSKGEVEKLARLRCKHHSLFGYSAGSVFVTEAPKMKALGIIHAVTMKFPGSKSKLKTIKKLIPEIVRAAEYMHFSTVAVPLLGTGTGGLSEQDVYCCFLEESSFTDSNVRFWIYTNFCRQS